MVTFANTLSAFFIADGSHNGDQGQSKDGGDGDGRGEREYQGSVHSQRSASPSHNQRHRDPSSIAEDPIVNTQNAARQYAKQSTSSYGHDGAGKVVNATDLDGVDSPTIGSHHMDTHAQQRSKKQSSGAAGDQSQINAEANAEQIASMLNQDLGAQVDTLQRQVDESKDQMLRAIAEMENLRRRTERERSDLLRYGAMGLAKDILAVVDNMYRALDLVRDSQGVDRALIDGLKMVLQQLDSTLAQHNITRVVVNLGDPLNPQHHQAMAEEKSDQYPPGHVVRVVSSGYTMHDRLLRPAQVMVASRDSVPSHHHDDTSANGDSA